MDSIQAKKAEICSLWGLPISNIDSKLAQLKIIIADQPERSLLEYLLQSDLDIERAIDLHFAGSTPSPQPNNNNNNNHNHISDNHNEEQIEFIFADDDNAPPPNQRESSEDIQVLNSNNLRESTSPTLSDSDDPFMDIFPQSNSNRDNLNFEFVFPGIEKDDDRDVLSTNNNINNRNQTNRKRKRAESEINHEIQHPLFKKRKLNALNTNNAESDGDNTDNINHNNSNHNPNEHKQMDPMDIDIEDVPEAKHDPNWNKKVFGTLKLEFSDHQRDTDVSSLYHLSLGTIHDRITIDNVGPHPFERDETKLRALYDHCLGETNHRDEQIQTGIKSIVKSKVCLSEDNDDDDKEYEEALQNEIKKLTSATFLLTTQEPWLKQHIIKLAERRLNVNRNAKKYSIEFEMSFNRAQSSVASSFVLLRGRNRTTSFEVKKAYTIALLGRSKVLMDDILETQGLLDKYTEKNHIYSMVSLLDFACRFDYDIEDTNDNYPHQLNVSLHQYQLQSLRWMIDEENDAIGFYRHLFKKGRFKDNTSFYYCAIFNEMIINDTLPVQHGGFLCEEMGLGKTIISLALINCNTPNDLSEYSTANDLKLSHTRTERRFRWENADDPANARRVGYDVTFNCYKSKATLIIAPVSLVGQWEKECDERCDKELKCKRYYGSTRSRDIRKYIEQDIIFTTYGILAVERGEDNVKHILHQIEWHRIILDESHYIKNGQSGAAKSINKLRSQNRWCLTGTPFGRQIFDIHNQLQFIGLQPQHLNVLNLRNIAKRKLFNGADNVFGRATCMPLMRIVQKLVMRHKKAQKFNNKAIVKMPEKEEDVIFVEFTAKQREYYNKLYSTAKERYDYFKTLNNIGRGSLSILASLHPSRQACSGYIYSKENIEQELSNAQARTFHIRNMVKSNSNLNISRQELYEMAQDEAFNDRDGECPICYECPFDEPLQTPCRHIFCGECIRAILQEKQQCPMCRKPVFPKQLKKPKSDKMDEEKKEDDTNDNNDNNNNGGSDKEEKEDQDDNGDQIKFDSKLKVLIRELKKIKRERPREKSLIFTSFSKSLDWMCSELKKNGFEYRTLTGSMTMNKRKKQLNEFSNNDNVNIFVLTVRSGAVGITLTAANHVFMLEPPFNAALHRQAINRVYRLGQTKKVFIHTLIMKDSIEERIWNVNKHKQNNNNNSNNNGNSNKNLAGNICTDKNAKLDQHEISKLFEGDE